MFLLSNERFVIQKYYQSHLLVQFSTCNLVTDGRDGNDWKMNSYGGGGGKQLYILGWVWPDKGSWRCLSPGLTGWRDPSSEQVHHSQHWGDCQHWTPTDSSSTNSSLDLAFSTKTPVTWEFHGKTSRYEFLAMIFPGYIRLATQRVVQNFPIWP